MKSDIDKAKTYLSILDLTAGATFIDVKNSYKELCMIWHPDRHPSKLQKKTTRKLQLINEAYEFFSNNSEILLHLNEQQNDRNDLNEKRGNFQDFEKSTWSKPKVNIFKSTKDAVNMLKSTKDAVSIFKSTKDAVICNCCGNEKNKLSVSIYYTCKSPICSASSYYLCGKCLKKKSAKKTGFFAGSDFYCPKCGNAEMKRV